MALMTDDMQEKLIKLLTDEGLVSRDVIKRAAQAITKIGRASCRERV